MAGVKKHLQQQVTVGVAQTVRVDATLEVGSVNESVVVSAKAPMLKTESAEQSFNIESERINALPLHFGAR